MVSHFKRRHLVSVILCQFLFNWSLSSAALSNLDLRSSVSSGNYVYVHQTIVIICTTTNTHYLAWRSDEYIGQGQQLIFNSTLPPGYSRMSAMGAIATLVRIQDGNGDLSLQCRLEIIVSSNFSRSSVTCENVDLGSVDMVSWNTRDQPATQLNQSRIKACEGRIVYIECLVRDSSAIHFVIHRAAAIPGIKANCTTSGNSSSNNADAIVTRDRLSFINGTLELGCSLQFTATLSQESVTCLNSEIGVNRTINLHVRDCDSSSTPVPTSNGNNTATGNTAMTDHKDVKQSIGVPISDWLIAVIIVAGVLCVLVVAAILCIIIVPKIFYRRARKRRISTSGNKNNSGTENVVQASTKI